MRVELLTVGLGQHNAWSLPERDVLEAFTTAPRQLDWASHVDLMKHYLCVGYSYENSSGDILACNLQGRLKAAYATGCVLVHVAGHVQACDDVRWISHAEDVPERSTGKRIPSTVFVQWQELVQFMDHSIPDAQTAALDFG